MEQIICGLAFFMVIAGQFCAVIAVRRPWVSKRARRALQAAPAHAGLCNSGSRTGCSRMEEHMTRFYLTGATLAGMLLATSLVVAPASAQGAYPARPIKIVLPIPPGTALDVVTRMIAEQMTSSLGQQVVIETRPGAGGLLAAQAGRNGPGGRLHAPWRRCVDLHDPAGSEGQPADRCQPRFHASRNDRRPWRDVRGGPAQARHQVLC